VTSVYSYLVASPIEMVIYSRHTFALCFVLHHSSTTRAVDSTCAMWARALGRVSANLPLLSCCIGVDRTFFSFGAFHCDSNLAI
jgi:hypothetical protein